jgi:hypothetical protein
MAIVRITKNQIEAANKAREAALQKDPAFRAHQEQQQRTVREAAVRGKGETS